MTSDEHLIAPDPDKDTQATAQLGRRQYLLNILWSWAGVLVIVATGLLVVPYLIRTLGAAQYGVWALALSFVEYFWLIDLGFRPGLVKYTAEYRVLNRTQELNQIVNTALLVAGLGGLIVLVILWPSATGISHWLKIESTEFPFLLRIVAASWSMGLVFNVFGAALEGAQRFDVGYRIGIVTALVRSVGIVLAVHWGHSLKAMGLILLGTQCAAYAGAYYYFRNLLPEVKLDLRRASQSALKLLLGFAKQVLPAVGAARLLQAGIPPLIAYFLPVRNVTYYTVSQKFLDYAGEIIGRIGTVTTPRASAWIAKGARAQVIQLAACGNRYCLILWGLLAAFLTVFTEELTSLWVNAEFAQQAKILIPPLCLGYAISFGQFISASVLMAAGRYQSYAWFLMLEAMLVLACSIVLLPAFGLPGLAVVLTLSLALNRGLNLARIFCKEFAIPLRSYLADIFVKPLGLIIGSSLALAMLKPYLLLAGPWSGLLLAWTFHCTSYGVVAGVFLVEAEHRAWLVSKAQVMWTRVAKHLG